MAKKNYDYLFKILLVGDSNVDKTGIMFRFSEDSFNSTFISTIHIDFKIKQIQLEGKTIKLQIWDTAGQERFRSIGTSFFRGAMGIMLVYDITNENSFQSVEKWIQNIKEYAAEATQLILVGNKCEEEHKRQVSRERGKMLADKNGMNFLEISSKTGMNVEEAFFSLARSIKAKFEMPENLRKVQAFKESLPQKNSGSGRGSFLQRWLRPTFDRQENNKTVPQEIDQDPYARELYEKALKDGKEKDKSIRVNIVGNYRQGKTSLMRRLLYQSLSGVESTNGIDIGKYECLKSRNGKLVYTKSAPDDEQTILKRLVRVALSESENTSVSELNEPNVTNTNEEPELGNKSQLKNKKQPDTLSQSNTLNAERTGANMDLTLGSKHPSNTSKKDVDNQRTKVISESKNDEKIAMLTLEQKRKFEKEIKTKSRLEPTNKIQTSFDFWDFGGQFVFYATHTMFHSRKAIYLLVFDLTTPLNQEVINEDFPLEQGSKTMAHYIKFWMNSIHSFVGTDDGKEPVALLVGTHTDKIPGSEETKSKYIKKYFSNIRELLYYTFLLNHIYPHDFSVNNRTSMDQAVDALRNTIMEIGDHLSSMIEIPAKWIQPEKSLNERKHLKIILAGILFQVCSMRCLHKVE